MFKKYTVALTVIDLATHTKILVSRKSLEIALEELRVEVHVTGHRLIVLRIDNEFRTAYRAAALYPHKHHSIGDIERFNQTLENAVFQKMYGKKYLTIQYWAIAFEDYTVHGPCQCPYELWTGKHPDLITLPTIPFGSVRIA